MNQVTMPCPNCAYGLMIHAGSVWICENCGYTEED